MWRRKGYAKAYRWEREMIVEVEPTTCKVVYNMDEDDLEGGEYRVWNQNGTGLNTSSLTSYVTLGTLPNFSQPQVPSIRAEPTLQGCVATQ